MSAFFDMFADMLSSSVTATPVTVNGKGTVTPSGDPITFAVRATETVRFVRDKGGREVVSTESFIADAELELTLDGFVYSVDGGMEKRALSVATHRDESGPVYVEVYLP